jgi:hypothetical protein
LVFYKYINKKLKKTLQKQTQKTKNILKYMYIRMTISIDEDKRFDSLAFHGLKELQPRTSPSLGKNFKTNSSINIILLIKLYFKVLIIFKIIFIHHKYIYILKL